MSTGPQQSRLSPFKPMPFGRYVLLAPIASGGMGQVFLAKARGVEGFEKLCVIKKILPALAKDPEFVGRFVDEAKILVKLTHGSIAQVFDMGEVDEDFYIAIEFVDGKDLRQVIARQRERGQPISPALGSYLMTRVLDALAYAHRKTDESDRPLGLVHRDISPQNILLSYEGEVKMIDFGLAKVATGTRRTSPSVVMGKFYYMAPEQATHIDVDKRVDLYAAGMVLYEMLAGRHPLEGTPAHLVFERLMNPNIPPLSRMAPGVPQALCDAVDKALSVDPDQRYASAEEMRGKLQAVQLEIDSACGPESLSRYMREAFKEEHLRERGVIAGLAAATVQTDEAPSQHTRSFFRAMTPNPTLAQTRVEEREEPGRDQVTVQTQRATMPFGTPDDGGWGARMDGPAAEESGPAAGGATVAVDVATPGPAPASDPESSATELATGEVSRPRRWPLFALLGLGGATAAFLVVWNFVLPSEDAPERPRPAPPAASLDPKPAPPPPSLPPLRPARPPSDGVPSLTAPPAEPPSRPAPPVTLPSPAPAPPPRLAAPRPGKEKPAGKGHPESHSPSAHPGPPPPPPPPPAPGKHDPPPAAGSSPSRAALESAKHQLDAEYKRQEELHGEKFTGCAFSQKDMFDSSYEKLIDHPDKYAQLQDYVKSVKSDIERCKSGLR